MSSCRAERALSRDMGFVALRASVASCATVVRMAQKVRALENEDEKRDAEILSI